MVCFTLLLFSCDRNKKLTEMVQAMQNKEISLPATIRPYQHTDRDTIDWTQSTNNRIVVYFSSDMCTVCNINKLHEWDKIKKRYENWDIVYVLSYQEKKEEDIIEAITNNNVNDMIIYLDKNDLFRKANPFIPDYPLLHVFLIDSNNRIKIVGDPLYNNKVLQLYDDCYISCTGSLKSQSGNIIKKCSTSSLPASRRQ